MKKLHHHLIPRVLREGFARVGIACATASNTGLIPEAPLRAPVVISAASGRPAGRAERNQFVDFGRAQKLSSRDAKAASSPA